MSTSDYAGHMSVSDENVSDALKGENDKNYPKRRGIDFYHRYKEDLSLLPKWG